MGGGTSGASPGTSGTTGTTAGASTTGGSGGGAPVVEKPPTGVKLTGSSAYTLLSGADAAPGPTPAPAKYGTSAGAACYTCHGANGEGLSGLGPELRHTPPVYATAIVRHGRPGTIMVPFPATSDKPEQTLNDPELTEVLTWLGSLPRPTTPEGLYKDFCGTCHGPTNGNGGAVPYKVTGLAKTAVELTVRSGAGNDPTSRNTYMPKFDTTMLSDAELAQIQTFLGSL
jgi:mono/diheme cytochrome c family protein